LPSNFEGPVAGYGQSFEIYRSRRDMKWTICRRRWMPTTVLPAITRRTEVKGNVIGYKPDLFEVKELSVPVSQADEFEKSFYRIIAGDERNTVVLKARGEVGTVRRTRGRGRMALRRSW